MKAHRMLDASPLVLESFGARSPGLERNAFAWSYGLLSPAEQRLFRHLGVFVGGCTVDAAEHVCRTGRREDDLGFMASLARVVECGLVRRVEVPGVTEARLVLLEPFREYALELLAAHGEADVARRRHASTYLSLMESIEPELQGPNRPVWLGRLAREHANVLLGLRWLMQEGGVERSWPEPASIRVASGWHAGRRLETDGAVAVALGAADEEARMPGGLTQRESEVLRLLAAGHTNKEIASELSLSVATVERHIANIYAKIGARGRADATAYALTGGFVSYQAAD